MKFALIDGVKALPQPKVIGICLFCGSRMKANCGKHKIWHWAHISKQDCDPWWESETEWHRQWKNYFLIEYQEVIHIDNNTGEKHIADIKTKNDMVIEFQNSPITREEVSSREDYYKKMFWIVNGDRKGTLNRINFELGIGTQYKTKSKDPFIIEFLWIGRSKLFENWSFFKVPIFFDFGYNELFWLYGYDIESSILEMRVIDKKILIEKNGGKYEPIQLNNKHFYMSFCK